MSPEEEQADKDYATFVESRREIKAGIKCPWCFEKFEKPTGCPTVHAKCAGGRSFDRLERLGYKRYGS